MTDGLNVLVVDDERPVLDELVYLLGRDDRISTVNAADSGAGALRALEASHIDVIFLDIAMPGLGGLEVARILDQFKTPPKVIFVTAHEAHAVDAFELNAVDYLLKPVHEERLRESVRRALQETAAPAPTAEQSIAVELAGVTRFVSRRHITYVEAQGDYVRLHTLSGDTHLLRTPLTILEQEWAEDFVRIHRSHLVSVDHIVEVRMQSGRCSILVPDGPAPVELLVARRHTRSLRDVVADRHQ